MQDISYACPGYETVFSELLSLARLANPNAAPTGIILSGCSGVGKSRMMRLLEREISRISATDGTSFDVVNVSAKDILLDMASSSVRGRGRFDLNCALEPVVTNSATKVIQRLLIVDDLDVLISEFDGAEILSSPNFESEQQCALNQVVKLIDATIFSLPFHSFVVGVTRTPLAQLPAQLARVGRFEKEVAMPPPSLRQRRDIFRFWLSTLSINNSSIVEWADLLAPRTAGCVAFDIRRICADALAAALSRESSSLGMNLSLNNAILNTRVKWNDIKEAAQSCVPSQLTLMDVIPVKLDNDSYYRSSGINAREEFDLAWKEFGGYNDVKTRLFRTIVRPWRYHIVDAANGSSSSSISNMLESSRPSGILFHGPAGNGKTLAAMCLASSLGLNCVKVRSSEVLSQWLGGSEATLRSIFSRARAASPCILLIDELDSLAMNRESEQSSAASSVQSRILTTLLNEMDGINACSSQSVLVVAATNRLDSIDAALLRPGRLEEHILLTNPDSSSVFELMKMRTAKMPLSDCVSLLKWSEVLSQASASCAEVEGICRDSCLIAMRRCSSATNLDMFSVTDFDIKQAFDHIRKNIAHAN